MAILYEKRPLNFNDKQVGMVFPGRRGSADLATLYNAVTFKYASVYGQEGPVPEKDIKSVINDFLEQCMCGISNLSDAKAVEVRHVLSNIRTAFTLQPCLSGNQDFVDNASYRLCRFLKLCVLHGWVLDEELSNYDSLHTFSHQELLKHTDDLKGQKDHVCDALLVDFENQLTSYGFESLSNELDDDATALFLFCKRLNIIHKHSNALYLFVTDEEIHRRMPGAVWRLLEKCQEKHLYFTENYIPVKGQKYENEAKEWYKKLVQTPVKEEDETQQKSKRTERNRAKKMKRKLKLSEQGKSRDVAEPCETIGNEGETTGNEGNVKSSDELTPEDGKKAETSHHSEDQDDNRSADKTKSEEAQSVDAGPDNVPEGVASKFLRSPIEDDGCFKPTKTAGNEGEDKSSTELARQDDKEAEKSGSHHSEDQNDNSSSPVKTKREVQSFDAVPEGVASEFFTFLLKFKDDACSEPYFKGIVAAFDSHRPLFYVPYEFIVAHDEQLAPKIQDDYTRIYEDLKKSVVHYLAINEVDFRDAILKISGLPEPKSVQSFLDFVKSINLHEHYDVYGADPEALPSYESRRMGLGYLGCIVAKFKTGRCWAGKWSESNMKVKNKGSEFVIDLKEDYELTPELGFRDLTTFCEIIPELLRFNGRLPPYFDEFQSDTFLINECFGKPGKWERFLELMSYPLAFKPPLVRSSLYCNVYLAGNGSSSGELARFVPLFRKQDNLDWRREAIKHPFLNKVYFHQNTRKIKKLQYFLDSWAAKHWHVFKFSRHFTQHVLKHTKGEDLIQKVKDISVIDIMLSRAISEAIAKAVRFLVLNCGVDGLFSSAWRHYIGSDYVDKPNGNMEDATASDMAQVLVDSITDDRRTGYLYTEVSICSASLHQSVIISDADLNELQTKLNAENFKPELKDGRLCCGSVYIWKDSYPRTKTRDGGKVTVVEGPFSSEYNVVFDFVTTWLGL